MGIWVVTSRDFEPAGAGLAGYGQGGEGGLKKRRSRRWPTQSPLVEGRESRSFASALNKLCA
jgi:hypothetical protein